MLADALEHLVRGIVDNPDDVTVTSRSLRRGALPHWATQHFAQSLKSFKLGCEKLRNREGWQDVCTQAAQTGEHHFSAKAFFEKYFTNSLTCCRIN